MFMTIKCYISVYNLKVYMSLSLYTSLGTHTGTKWMHATTLSRYSLSVNPEYSFVELVEEIVKDTRNQLSQYKQCS